MMELMKIEVISYICIENSYFSLSLSRDSEGYVGIEKNAFTLSKHNQFKLDTK